MLSQEKNSLLALLISCVLLLLAGASLLFALEPENDDRESYGKVIHQDNAPESKVAVDQDVVMDSHVGERLAVPTQSGHADAQIEEFDGGSTHLFNTLGFKISVDQDVIVKSTTGRYQMVSAQSAQLDGQIIVEESLGLTGLEVNNGCGQLIRGEEIEIGGEPALLYTSEGEVDRVNGGPVGPVRCNESRIGAVTRNSDTYYYILFYGDQELSLQERSVLESFAFVESKVEGVLVE